ncbi:MAG: TIGR02584 family CRISPR-associated protein [Akkermansiaceae bacterium]|nr:TIGR02584 family CRISPR-associated protein [Akkermansiaceae bacterium]
MKTTLLATTGLSPAIVTETVWALAQMDPPVIPNYVEIITTKTGKNTCKEALHTPLKTWGGKTVWETLREHVGAGPGQLIALPVQCIHIPDHSSGRSIDLDDIQTPEENSAAAEFIFSRVWNVVRDSDQCLVASIAGGRKTMGALLHAAVSLIGRETDLLTHILVNPPYDTLRGFFFPGQPGGDLLDWNKNIHSPDKAVPILAEVPFVPLRNRFKDLDDLPGSFIRLKNNLSSQLARDSADAVSIEIDYNGNCLTVGGLPNQNVNIRQLSLLHFLLACNEENAIPPSQAVAADTYNDWLNSVRQIIGETPPNMDEEDFRKILSALRTQTLKKAPWQPASGTLKQAPFVLNVVRRVHR